MPRMYFQPTRPRTHAIGRLNGCALAVAIVVLLVVSAVARADVEPNDSVIDAQGPLLSGGPWSGTVAGSDMDVYVFYVAGPARVDVALTATSGSCVIGAVRNDPGFPVASGGADGGQTRDLTLDTPAGTSRWFLQVNGGIDLCGGGDYQFTLASTGGRLVDGPVFSPSTAVTAGINDEDAPFGPLRSDVNYSGLLRSETEDDFLYFETPPGAQQVDVQVASANSGCDLSWTVDAPDNDDLPYPILFGMAFANGVDEQQFTSPSTPTRFVLDVTPDCAPAPWVVRVSAPGGLVTPAPSSQQQGGTGSTGASQLDGTQGTGGVQSSSSCTTARRALATARKTLARKRHALLVAHSHAARHAAARRLRAARDRYRSARRRVHTVC
jgi:hypothetical protein